MHDIWKIIAIKLTLILLSREARITNLSGYLHVNTICDIRGIFTIKLKLKISREREKQFSSEYLQVKCDA